MQRCRNHRNHSRNWAATSKRLLIIVDCQILQKLVTGEAVLEKEQHRPTFRRMADNLLKLAQKGWRPKTDWEAFVQWVPRDLNSAADAVANHTMNKGSDIDLGTLEARHVEDRNVLVNVDGGLRWEQNKAATGWVIGRCLFTDDAGWSYASIMCHGTYLRQQVTPFMTELIALDEAISMLVSILT